MPIGIGFQSPFNRDSNCNRATYAERVRREGFQSPFNRDSNCNPRTVLVSTCRICFQSPFNRDSNCNRIESSLRSWAGATFSPLLIGIAIVTTDCVMVGSEIYDTFSPLLIGIAIVTPLNPPYQGGIKNFQSPFNRDSNCNEIADALQY